MTRYPQRHHVVTARAEILADRPHAVGTVGEAVNEQRAADGFAIRREDLRTVPVRPELSRMRMTIGVVAVRRQPRGCVEFLLDLFMDHAKGGILDGQIVGEGRAHRQVGGAGVSWNDSMPRLEIGNPASGVQGAANDDGREHEHG